MKKTISIFIFINLLNWSQAQQTQFNRIYDVGYATGRSVFYTDSAYFLVGAYAGENINHPYLGIWKFDTLGNVMWYKTYGDDTLYRSNDAFENACKKIEKGYATVGDCLPTIYDPENWIRLYRFNQEFDTLWTKDFLHDTVDVYARDLVYCSDGGFAIVGFSKRDEATGEVLPQYTGKGFLLRTDSLGNYLWHKTYGEWDYGQELCKVVQTPDGGFLCGGATKSYSSNHTWDWYLVKTDSLGQEQWHRTYGNSSADDSRICGITLTKDTNYVITGGRGVSSTSYDMRPYIKVLDKNFNDIVTKNFPYQSSGSAYAKVIELPNGNFIVNGTDRVNSSDILIVNLTKFDADFNEIWRRQYTAYDTSNVDNYMLSVDTCSDGGYVLGGWAAVYDGNGQRISLIKTDEYGCDGTDWWACLHVEINELVRSEDTFTVYPNPASESLTLNMPVQTGIHSPTVEIYNLTGKLVKQFRFEAQHIKLDISDLESGIYIVKYGAEIKKLIIE